MNKHICAHPECTLEGTFPAPRDPKNIYDRQYFCQTHIAEFNKKWNGLTGMSEDDIFSMQTKSTWERPTQPFGVHGENARKAQFSFGTSDDLYAFFKQRQKREFLDSLKYGKNEETPFEKETEKKQDLPPDVQESCSIFNIELPIESKKLKSTYLQLIKKHHPDKNAGSKKAEEHVKRINVAYQILKDFMGL